MTTSGKRNKWNPHLNSKHFRAMPVFIAMYAILSQKSHAAKLFIPIQTKKFAKFFRLEE